MPGTWWLVGRLVLIWCLLCVAGGEFINEDHESVAWSMFGDETGEPSLNLEDTRDPVQFGE